MTRGVPWPSGSWRIPSGGRIAIMAALACAWIALEGWLRGEAASASLDTTSTMTVGGVTLVAAIAARMRTTLRGEREVARELASLIVAVATLPLALLLVAYAVATALSVASVAGGWALILSGVVIAGVVHVVAWLGFLLGIVSADEAPIVMFVWAALWYFGLSALSEWLFDDAYALWTFAMCRMLFHLYAALPPWGWALAELRSAVAGVELTRLEVQQLSTAAGMVGALPLALALRWGRRHIAGIPTRRAYLPMASAPVPDGTPLVPPALRMPSICFIALVWAFLSWRW